MHLLEVEFLCMRATTDGVLSGRLQQGLAQICGSVLGILQWGSEEAGERK